jgi:hypothetical protein
MAVDDHKYVTLPTETAAAVSPDPEGLQVIQRTTHTNPAGHVAVSGAAGVDRPAMNRVEKTMFAISRR